MYPKPFKRKKFSTPDVCPTLSLMRDEEACIGVFNGYNVSIHEYKSIQYLYEKGNFGKGSLSKSKPSYQEMKDDVPMIVMKQQWENQLKWESKVNIESEHFGVKNADTALSESSVRNFLESSFLNCEKDSWKKWKFQNSCSCKTTIATQSSVPKQEFFFQKAITEESNEYIDASFYSMVDEILETRKIREASEIYKKNKMLILVAENSGCREFHVEENFNTDIEVTLKSSLNQIEETLKLNLSEAFFLCFALGCLKIVSESGDEMNIKDLWSHFCEKEENFIEKYVAYHHYRSFNWTVKSGLKFSGDFLLYKIGPSYYHASFLVRILDKKKRMSWSEYIALNRLVESYNKDLLLCEIIAPKIKDEDTSFGPDILSQFSILEMISRRWIPSRERDSGNV